MALSHKARIAIGAVFAAFSMVVSGVLVGSAPAQDTGATYTPDPVVKQRAVVKRDAAERRDCFRPRCYGALALANGDSAVGGVYNYAHRWRAQRAALRSCKARSSFPRTCHGKGWVRNGCRALSIKRRANGSVARWGTGVAFTKRAAYREALGNCNRPRCVRWAHVCTARS